jgi:DNA-directed RNA polymerase subunit RPC12/RpoP
MNSLHDDRIIPSVVDTRAPTCEACGQRMWLTRVETKVGASIESKKQYECKECGAQIWNS